MSDYVGGLILAVKDNMSTIAAAGTGAMGWVTARQVERRKQIKATDEEIDELTDALHAVDKDLAQLKFLLSAATGLDVGQLTLERIKMLVSGNVRILDDLIAFIQTAPCLVWIKQRRGPGDFVMEQVSQLYADLYLGQSANYYSGKADIEILAAAFTYPDPDGDGSHGGLRGDIRLIDRDYARAAIRNAKKAGRKPPCRILSNEESRLIDIGA